MSARERPELAAFRELETLVRNLGEQVSVYRHRAAQAEAQLKEHAAAPARGRGAERIATLESENGRLRTRLSRAEDRVKRMLERVRFLRQQVQSAGNGRP
jgi:predicted nuclease with TOPRIM domain